MWICGIACGDVCIDCGFPSHSFEHSLLPIRVFGKGKMETIYKNQVLYSDDYDFTTGVPSSGRPHVLSVRFRNKDFSEIVVGDVHDVQESIALEIRTEWDGEPTLTFPAVVEAAMTGDSLIVDMPQVQREGDLVLYQWVFPPGQISRLYGDPASVFAPMQSDILTAHAGPYLCHEVDLEIIDETCVADIKFYVKELSFDNDYTIYEDSMITNVLPNRYKEVEIRDPVWQRTPSRNKPAYYNKGGNLDIKLVVQTDFVVQHSFEFAVTGIPQSEYLRYRTQVRTGNLFGNCDTVSSLRAVGNFPDSVGIIDSINYAWMVYKSGLWGVNGFVSFDITGPHKIYLAYNNPLLDTVNTLGLDYICKYSKDLNDINNILVSSTSGIYTQHWEYNPDHFLFAKPLDMIRKKPTGQCADYANLLTYFLNAIGILSNTTVIFNGKRNSADSIEFYLWKYTVIKDFTNLLSNELRACNDSTMKWDFWYHAVSRYNNILSDPVFNIVADTNQYSLWWEYYLHPHPISNPPYYFLTDHPPPFPPYYHDWSPFIKPNKIMPERLRIRAFDFSYP
jgi:hypothetical protein